MFKTMASIADTLSQKPEVGIFGSVVGVALSPIAIISLVSAVLGLLITIITLIIKIIDVQEKIKIKKRFKENDIYQEFNGKKYRLTEVEMEEE
jgi:hypothetical protein